MISTPTIAATLPPKIRKEIGIQALSRSIPVARIARENQVSQKFVYEQKSIAAQALDESFLATKRDDEVLFYLRITKTWLFQKIDLYYRRITKPIHTDHRKLIGLYTSAICGR